MKRSENSADLESLVSSFGAFVAFRHVCRETAGEGQHLARFAGNVRAEIPGVRAREESCVRKSMHLQSPLFFRGGRCLEPRPIALSNVVQQLSDPIALKLGASRSIGEGVRAVRAVNEEEIGEPRRGHSEMGTYTLRPLLLQCLALRAADIGAGPPRQSRHRTRWPRQAHPGRARRPP